MKKSKQLIFAICIIGGIALFGAGIAIGSSTSAKPGSSGDQLITVSYLEERLAEVTASSYKKVTLAKGKKLTLESGGEMILYSGSASTIGSKGLINLTNGKLFKSGDSLSLYNLYFSSDSSSGLTAKSDCIIYMKGKYKIV